VVTKTVVRRPVTPPALPQATATSTNILAASVGTAVNMSWGEGTPEAGGGAGYLPPRLLTKVDTDALYTDKMKAGDEEGDVVVDLWIDPKGKILRSKLTVPSVWDDMNKISLNVLKNLKFTPAMLNGQPVAGKFELNFRFRIRNSG
jgi:protein TonB